MSKFEKQKEMFEKLKFCSSNKGFVNIKFEKLKEMIHTNRIRIKLKNEIKEEIDYIIQDISDELACFESYFDELLKVSCEDEEFRNILLNKK